MKWMAALALAGLAACSPIAPASISQNSQAAGQAELAMFEQRITRDYVDPFAAGDVERWLLIFDDDVVALHNRMPSMRGKEALRGFASFVRDNLTVADMSVTLEGVRREGALAYTWGTYHSRLLLKPSGEPMPGHSENGKVLFIWKLQKDGSWKIVLDMGNAIRSETPDQAK